MRIFYNKNKESIKKNAKNKNFFYKYKNLNLLPYLKRKANQKINENKFYFSTFSKVPFYKKDKKNNNNIDEYSSKIKYSDINFRKKQNKAKKEQKDQKEKDSLINQNRVKYTYIKNNLNFKNIFSDNILKRKNILNNDNKEAQNNNNEYNYNSIIPLLKRQNEFININNNKEIKKETEIDNENEKNKIDCKKDTPKRNIENSLKEKNNSDNKDNKSISFTLSIKSKKIENFKQKQNSFSGVNIYDIKNNVEVHFQSIKFGKNEQQFNQISFNNNKKNKYTNLFQNLTFREDNKDSKSILYNTPLKNESNNKINQNSDIFYNKSKEENFMKSDIKTFYDNRKFFSNEAKINYLKNIKNLNIKKYKYNLKQTPKESKNNFKNISEKYEVMDSFLNIKDGSKVSADKAKSLIKDKTKNSLGKFNLNMRLMTQNCQILFNRNMNRKKKNNNDDIIGLI